MASISKTVVVPFASILGLGTLLFSMIEGFRLVDAFYFTGMTLSTVGFGDYHPRSLGGRVAVIVFSFAGMGFFGYLCRQYGRHNDILQEDTVNITDMVIRILKTIGIGVLLFSLLEGWAWDESLYFSFVTLSTIGYGDITPKTDLGKIASVFYVAIAGVTIAETVATIGDVCRKKVNSIFGVNIKGD